jgi:hypothetical protein
VASGENAVETEKVRALRPRTFSTYSLLIRLHQEPSLFAEAKVAFFIYMDDLALVLGRVDIPVDFEHAF